VLKEIVRVINLESQAVARVRNSVGFFSNPADR